MREYSKASPRSGDAVYCVAHSITASLSLYSMLLASGEDARRDTKGMISSIDSKILLLKYTINRALDIALYYLYFLREN